jgi:type IX secretion system PorP/SprF family membrane protein
MIIDRRRYGYILMVLIFMTLFYDNASAQQEPMYSQYMFNMLHINPAYAGNKEVDNITFLGRSQWVGIPGAPKTMSVSWDRRNEGSNVGVGAQVYGDKVGIETTTGVQLFYSYHIPFNNASLSFGLSGGLINYRASYSETKPLDTGDDMFQSDINGWLPTAGFGVLLSAEHWYAGLSIPALLHAKIQDANYINQNSFGADNHYFVTGGYLFDVSPIIKMKPSILVKSVSGAPIEIDYNLNGWYNDLMCLGLSYRSKDAIVGMFELKITSQLRIGYAYDYSISNLGEYNQGSHEIMLRYEFSKLKKEKVYSLRYY